jgi:hypothetical protein
MIKSMMHSYLKKNYKQSDVQSDKQNYEQIETYIN